MSTTQPTTRIEFAEREVGRFVEDIQDWKQRHDEVAKNCWPLEDLVAKANYVFVRIMGLDTDIQEGVLNGQIEFDPLLDEQIRSLLKRWHDISREVLPHVERLNQEYQAIDGSSDFRENFDQARMILTPDLDLFLDERLIVLRDAAIEAHRSSLTEPLLNHGRAE